MRLPRRTLLGTAAAASLLHRPARAENPTIRIGVLNDQSGPYRDDGGPTSVICVQQARPGVHTPRSPASTSM